jgi:hydroxypyruvate reductase
MNHPGHGELLPNWRWPQSALGNDAVRCFASAIAAVAPGPVVERALSRLGATQFTHLLAVGKAAVPMAEAAIRWQGAQGRSWRASLAVAPTGSESRLPGLTVVPGDHPVPSSHSAGAADAIARLAGELTADDHLLLLLSGGTTSLAGAPISGVSLSSVQAVFRKLLATAIDIHGANLVRKQFLRWGGGRLAAALAPAAVHVLAISDVPGEEPATIGSGPVSPDTSSPDDVAATLAAHGLELPADAAAVLTAMRRGERAGLPAPDDPCFSQVTYDVIASNRTALDAAAETARSLGYEVTLAPEGLGGEARAAGARIAHQLRAVPRGERRALILGGESTVTLGSASAEGGRNQELALAASRELQGVPRAALLAAGTDGTDGNSANAGGLVDGGTWSRIRDAATRLDRHESTAALAAAGAEFYTGPTGTNVMDVVIGIRG